MTHHHRIFIHVEPQGCYVCDRDLLAPVLLRPSQDMLHLRQPAYEIAADELAPPMPICLPVPLILFLLSEFCLKYL